jgi:hypothetical protein
MIGEGVTGQAPAIGAMAKRERFRPRKLHGYFVGFVLAFVAIVLAGFSRRFFLAIANGTFHHPMRVHIHAAFFFGWTILLVTQVILAATGRLRLHRTIGKWGGWLVIPMLVTGSLVAARDTQHDALTEGQSAISFFYGELADLAAFGLLAGTAFWFRDRPEWHKRLVLFSALALMGAAFGRIPEVASYGTSALLVMTLSVFGYDLAARRDFHLATLVGAVLLLTMTFTQTAIGDTEFWLSFAHRVLGV